MTEPRPGAPDAAPFFDGTASDGRLFAPTFERNGVPIRAALLPMIEGIDGTIVEVGCGSGQHAAAIAALCPDRAVLATDIVAEHRASAAAHAAADGLANMPAPRALDAAGAWAGAVGDLSPIAAILAINVVHIAPWTVAEGLFRGAGEALGPGGLLALYGPFFEPDTPLASSNQAFDASLKARDPSWGIRALDDLDGLARPAGLRRLARHTLPANNLLVVWHRSP